MQNRSHDGRYVDVGGASGAKEPLMAAASLPLDPKTPIIEIGFGWWSCEGQRARTSKKWPSILAIRIKEMLVLGGDTQGRSRKLEPEPSLLGVFAAVSWEDAGVWEDNRGRNCISVEEEWG